MEQRAVRRTVVIVIGLGRLGMTVIEELLQRGEDVLGVGVDPRTVEFESGEVAVVSGDLEDPALPNQLPLARVRWIVSTPRDPEVQRAFPHALHRRGYRGRVVAAADDPDDERMLQHLGVDLFIRPSLLAARPLMDTIHASDRRTSSGQLTLE